MLILRDNVAEICTLSARSVALIELGSGSSARTRVSSDRPVPNRPPTCQSILRGTHLLRSPHMTCTLYPELCITRSATDFTSILTLPEPPYAKCSGQSLFFRVQHIGDLEPTEAEKSFSAGLRSSAAPVVASYRVDLKKDRLARLNATYNDARGITASFNLNLLTRINSFIYAEIRSESFNTMRFTTKNLAESKDAFGQLGRSDGTVDGHPSLRAGRTRCHRNSYKYTVREFAGCAVRDGPSKALGPTQSEAVQRADLAIR